MRAFVFLLCCVDAVRAAAGEPAVRIAPDDGDPTRVVVSCAAPSELPAGRLDEAAGRRVLSMALVEPATNTAGPPILGSYQVADGRLTFRPRFGLFRGATYRIAAAGHATTDYRLPTTKPGRPPTVVGVTPAGRSLPANVLRFYITFSQPMREGREVLEQVHLLDDSGTPIPHPWRDLELWNADATRLSLFVHPGRIKQGVNLRVELGPVLEPGKRYTLVIDRGLRDAEGTGLEHDHRVPFTATAELRERIDVAAWRIREPATGSRQPLVVAFGRMLDDALARRCLAVRNSAGALLAGRVELDDDGRQWSFTPDESWRGERYELVVDPVLEDVCGNSPLRPFDVDLEQPVVDVVPPRLRREFTPH